MPARWLPPPFPPGRGCSRPSRSRAAGRRSAGCGRRPIAGAAPGWRSRGRASAAGEEPSRNGSPTLELDAAASADGLTHSAELCIVGGGPAGLTLAHALDREGFTIVLIESGCAGPEEGGASELNAGIVAGGPPAD